MTTTTAHAATESARSESYRELRRLSEQASLLGASASLLGWDQEVYMPGEGLDYRSQQIAQLAKLQHDIYTSNEFGELLEACEDDQDVVGDPLSSEAVNVREWRHTYDRKTRLPGDLVEAEARLASRGQHVWQKARQASDFSMFRPTLEQIVDLLRRKADCYGYDHEPWDALAEDYEPGCTAADVEEVFTPLRNQLTEFLQELMDGPTSPSNRFNELVLPIEKQQAFVRYISEQIGFDYDRGRLDVSTHPFCSGTHSNDVRLTTRFHDNNVNDALGSTMHETGHGMYEQGLLYEFAGTPMGQSVSLGIHESQSRMWENQVGRSLPFWRWCYPKLRKYFGDAVKELSFDDVYGAVNIVRPDFIRVEADEATYNLHIMVRFEIERAIMRGDLAVKDIPEVWNEKYKQYLGLDVPNDAKGCLQDIHWSMTSMGYFPTYTLGNLYAAQFFEKALADLPSLYDQFERGEFSALKSWLNENIHRHGKRYRAQDLCEVVTSKPLSAEPLMRHLESKLRPLYGV